MPNPRTLSLAVAVAAVGLASPLVAQTRSAVRTADLEAAVAARPASERDAVRDLLTSSQALTLARRMGVERAELEARVEMLDAAALDRLAERALPGERILAGGDEKVVISTTAIIIGLLVLILLVD